MSDHRSRLNWVTVGALALVHAGALAALFLFTWQALWLALALLWISGGWGIGMGYHRLLTHRGYETPRWLECILTVCGTLGLQGGPLFWVATHRLQGSGYRTRWKPSRGECGSPLLSELW
jgi:fatty-acid desaturase